MRAILSGTARRGEHGQIIVLFALSLLAIVAMAGLLIDGGRAWEDRRQAQIAADTGALAAGLEYAKGSTDPTALAAARSIAAMNGFNAATACDGTSLTSGTMVNGVRVEKPAADKVRVSVTRPMRTTFAGAVGQSCWMVSATAVAHWTGSSISGPTVFAAAKDCGNADDLKWNGKQITVYGDVVSNSGIDINSDAGAIIGGSASYVDTPDCDNTGTNATPSTIPLVTKTTYLDYPITFPADYFTSKCTYVMTISQVDKDGLSWYNKTTGLLSPGVYCFPGGDISVKVEGTHGNVTFVSGSVSISPKNTSFTPYLDGVFIYADGTGSKVINVSGENTQFQGLIFAPNGDIHLVGAALLSFTGNIWGQRIDLGGDGWTIHAGLPGSISPLEIVLVE